MKELLFIIIPFVGILVIRLVTYKKPKNNQPVKEGKRYKLPIYVHPSLLFFYMPEERICLDYEDDYKNNWVK